MPVPESFEAFRFALERAVSAGAILDQIEEAIGEVSDWTAERAASWLRELAPWLERAELQGLVQEKRLEAVEEPTYAELRETAIDLVVSLSNRVVVLQGTFPIQEIDDLVRTEACSNRTIRLPRRTLLERYEQWIEDGSVPCVVNYARQAARVATPEQRIRLARLATSPGTEVAEYSDGWLAVAILDLMVLDPESVIPWVERLREAWSSELDAPRVAQLEYFDRWIERSKRAFKEKSSGQPSDVIAIPEPIRPRREIARDLPAHVRDYACAEALEWLLSYQVLMDVEDVGLTIRCSHLGFAVEAQLRHVVTLKLPKGVARKVREQGLGSLARLMRGERSSLDDLARLAVEPDGQLMDQLTRAGQIRNRVHHPRDGQPLSVEDLEFLQTLIFDYTDFGRIFERMKSIDVMPK